MQPGPWAHARVHAVRSSRHARARVGGDLQPGPWEHAGAHAGRLMGACGGACRQAHGRMRGRMWGRMRAGPSRHARALWGAQAARPMGACGDTCGRAHEHMQARTSVHAGAHVSATTESGAGKGGGKLCRQTVQSLTGRNLALKTMMRHQQMMGVLMMTQPMCSS
eukprot:48400-Chlamydomonas_euryale.AAC.1